MPCYLTISVGPSGRTAKAILATSDQAVIQAALQALAVRTLPAPHALSEDELQPDDEESERDEAVDQ